MSVNDPFYQDILDRLDGDLDPQVFEDCMGDLLAADFPGLVPVRGGNDAGMDGAIPDGEGKAFPLICTTSEDVIGNLNRSLEARLKVGDDRRKIVLATSRKLTTQKRRNLEQRSKDMGFKLIQIFEARGLADRLYRNPQWCRDLLGLTGQPSALSAVPLTRRPSIEIEPVGREADLNWIRTTSGDRLLVGQPGSGKTFLLHHLVRKGWGLFLVSDDETAIANALREQQPAVVIVDDAHAYPERIDRLRHLREEIGAGFHIVATTWGGEEDQIVQALRAIEAAQIHHLELLTRPEIKEIYERAGVRSSESVLRELIEQAENKPGLAVTLAMLWLRGEWEKVLRGQAVTESLMAFLRQWVGKESTEILATFALGGDGGMAMDAAAKFLDRQPARIRQDVVALVAGGVLFDLQDNSLAVRPRAMRPPLLGDVFFSGRSTDLDYRPLLEEAPDFSQAVTGLIMAKARGVAIPNGELKQLMSCVRDGESFRSRALRAWSLFAVLGEDEAGWALEHYPGDFIDIARQVLEKAPSLAIPRLLERAGDVREPSASQPDHPLRILQEWSQRLLPDLEEIISRRRLLVSISKDLLQNAELSEIAVQAICLALSPNLHSHEGGALGDSVVIRNALLPTAQLSEIESIWHDVQDLLAKGLDHTWLDIKEMVRDWIYPRFPPGQDGPVEEDLHRFARQMLRDLAAGADRPGIITDLRRLASRIDLDLDLDLQPDETFELLYPPREQGFDNLDAGKNHHHAKLSDLAARWSERPVMEIVEKLTFYEAEARGIEQSWPRSVVDLCQLLAKQTSDVAAWIEGAFRFHFPADLLAPFLERVVDEELQGFERSLERCLGHEEYSDMAVPLILGLPHPPERLLDEAMKRAPEPSSLIESMCFQGKFSLDRVGELLRHRSMELALAIAWIEWYRSPRAEIREELRQDWREAVLRARPSQQINSGLNYSLGEILAADPILSYEWLSRRMKEDDVAGELFVEEVYKRAVESLTAKQKSDLLMLLGEDHMTRNLVELLVAQDEKLYGQLLGLELLEKCHLAPLEHFPAESWADLAAVALDRGYAPEDIVRAAVFPPQFYWGSDLRRWQELSDAFAQLEQDPRPAVRKMARLGRDSVEERREEARVTERREQR